MRDALAQPDTRAPPFELALPPARRETMVETGPCEPLAQYDCERMPRMLVEQMLRGDDPARQLLWRKLELPRLPRLGAALRGIFLALGRGRLTAARSAFGQDILIARAPAGLHGMGMRYVHESVIAAPPEAVFAFHERPDALAKLVPPWEKVEVLQPPASLKAGTRVLLRMKMGPLSLLWEAEHTQYRPGVLFQDRMVRGPFKSWLHTHRFLPAPGGGTLLRDEVEFTLPFFMTPGAPLVQRRLRRMFAYRHRVTAESLTPQPGAATVPA